MKLARRIALKNLKRRPARTAALLLIAAFLALSVFGGSILVMSLQNGLKSYEARLGADIVVMPYEARTKGAFESILLQGIPGTFYMDETEYEKIVRTDGVEVAAPQFFLASSSSGCCSASVQIIGFDPEKDFTVQPWIRERYGKTLGKGDLIVGSELTVPKDRRLTFYNTTCTVVAQLDQTGTGLDTAVYANMDTIREMITHAKDLQFHSFDAVDPDHAVSSVMIKVKEGYDVEKVTDDINIHVRHIEAARPVTMISGIAAGLGGASGIIRILMILIWLLAAVILSIAFRMIAHERAREFAVFQVMGASRKMVSRLLLTESAWVSALGALLGLAVASLIILPFGKMLGSRLELPYLLPEPAAAALLAAGSFLLAVATGALTSAIASYRLSRQDVAVALREGV